MTFAKHTPVVAIEQLRPDREDGPSTCSWRLKIQYVTVVSVAQHRQVVSAFLHSSEVPEHTLQSLSVYRFETAVRPLRHDFSKQEKLEHEQVIRARQLAMAPVFESLTLDLMNEYPGGLLPPYVGRSERAKERAADKDPSGFADQVVICR